MEKYSYPEDKYPPIDSLPEPVQKAIKEAFEKTRAMDLYGGNAVLYIKVMGQVLEDLYSKLDKLEEKVKEISELCKFL